MRCIEFPPISVDSKWKFDATGTFWNAKRETQHRAASNLLGALEGVVVARNVRHNRTFIRFRSVDQIYSIAIHSVYISVSMSFPFVLLLLIFVSTASIMVQSSATL